ncbi:hypothetical protein [Gordonia sihwensis]|uniref:hypothetical protein n=1 Tax=Gordonia sihwensis TaxID=173559 RepID=UPI0024159E04|nr:hypothetical protein [Gordonia sihwensis]WFN93469.1 hypothetical protein P5P27_02525 [Gordonia sihwensis]
MATPPTLVAATDVTTLLAADLPGEGTPERAQLDELCEQASAEIRARVVAVDARIAAGSLSAVRVRGVAVDMVLAALENIELGFRSTGETYPEIGTTQVAAANRLTVEMTAAQVAALSPVVSDAANGMYSVQMSS